ncbi:MAG: DUF4340 domain-containing protein [Clostridia bacterium]|nr:DUF4340 domain-containing protein [Clostridia bacterium]
MQKIEKKRQRKGLPPWAVILILLFALLILGGVLWRLETREQEEAAGGPVPREARGGTLTQRDASEIDRIEITRRGGEQWSVEREEGTLFPSGTRTWAVDPSIGDPLQDALCHLEYEEILAEDPAGWRDQAALLGLAEPRVRAVCRWKTGEPLEVRIGDRVAGTEDSLYYMTVAGDGRLFAASEGTIRDLDIEEALLHPVTQPGIIGALLDRITVADGEGKPVTEWALAGRITDSDAGESWQVTVPFLYPADGEAIAGLKKSAENLRMGAYDGEATAENLARTGLTHPTRILRFHMAAGSTGTVSDSGVYDVVDREAREVVIYLGADRDENVSWMRLGEEIYAVNRAAFSAFTETDPLETAARYPVAVPFGSLSSLTAEERGGSVTYTLERDGEGALKVRRNGEETDAAAFEAAYERLMTVTVTGRLPAGVRRGEATKKYTFRTVSGGTHTLEFWPFDGMHDGLTQDGCTMFYLIREGMPPLP